VLKNFNIVNFYFYASFNYLQFRKRAGNINEICIIYTNQMVINKSGYKYN